jgi:hypothetical protein
MITKAALDITLAENIIYMFGEKTVLGEYGDTQVQ